MKTFSILALAALLCGCNTTQFSRTATDGSVVTLKNSRWFWSNEGYTITLGTNTASINCLKSSPDAASLQAVAAGMAQGMIQGMK